MTNDLETRIRASLSERADDVEPTPELWRSVQKRTARQRVVPMVAWTAGLTAAAVTAFIVVPNVLDSTERSVSIEPLDNGVAQVPGPSDAPQAAVAATPYLGVDGRGRFVIGTDDGTTVVHAPAEPPSEASLSPNDIAVRPGSTVDDLDAVVLYGTEAGPELHRLRIRDGAVTDEPLPDAYQIGFDADLRHLQVPVWSPDGRHLAWVERSGVTSDWSLRTIGWDDGPGTGRPADDNASTVLPVSAADLVLSDWMWETAASGEDAVDGQLLFAVDREALEAEPMALRFAISRQDDGALAFADAFEPIREEGPQIVDLVRGGDNTDLLVRFGDGSYGVELQDGPTVVLELDPGTSPLMLDLDVIPGGVVVAHRGGGGSVVVSRDGSVSSIGAGDGGPLTAYERIG